jgi:hypothetical protein
MSAEIRRSIAPALTEILQNHPTPKGAR